jgi:hypothetical protein
MTNLGPLYHWSPRERLNSIKKLGLVPGRRNIQGPTLLNFKDPSMGEFRQDSVCFSLDPVTAWRYSHGAWGSVGTFDLWLVWIESTDEVHVLPNWGGRISEIRVKNRIPKSRLFWVGERVVIPKKRRVT